MEKGENDGCQHFLLFPRYLERDFFSGLKKKLRVVVKPITRRQILDSFKLKEFADDNFRCDENGRKLSKWVENIVGIGEIAR